MHIKDGATILTCKYQYKLRSNVTVRYSVYRLIALFMSNKDIARSYTKVVFGNVIFSNKLRTSKMLLCHLGSIVEG